jgi:hypothetical protein
MRHCRAILSAALLVLGHAASALASEPSAAGTQAFSEVMVLFAARTHGRVAFTEIHQISVLNTPVRSAGELIYVAPDRLEKHTLEPKPETLVLDHGVLSAQRGRHRYTVALSDAPQVIPFVESLRATLAGDSAALERYFTVTFEGDVARWRMSLMPRDASLASVIREIQMEGERDAILTVDIHERDGDRSQLSIGPQLPP